MPYLLTGEANGGGYKLNIGEEREEVEVMRVLGMVLMMMLVVMTKRIIV